MKKLLLFATILLSFTTLRAQFLACNGAVDLNITNAFMGPAQPEDTSIDYGCITATGRYVWYGYFTVCTPGSLTIGTSVASSSYDVDLVAWGPFSSTTIPCNQLNASNITTCSATPGPGEIIGFNLTTPGEVYMVAVVCDTNTAIPGYGTTGTAVVSGVCGCYNNAGIENLCLVTVDSATQEYKLVWTELAGNPVSHFGIMKADYLGVPQEIDTVHLTSLSQYIDVSADPNLHTEQYSLVTYDTCGSSWTSGNYIQPVFCQSSLSTQGTVNVSWSPYIDMSGNGPAYYVIYRGATPTNMVSIDTVATFVNNYTDINPLIGTSYYKIGTALFSACVPMRLQQSAQSQYQVQSYSNAAPITVVGIGENSLQHASFYPNPTSGLLTVSNVMNASTLRVFDVTGREVLNRSLQANSSQQVSLESLENGIYSVTIENETGFIHEEILIQR